MEWRKYFFHNAALSLSGLVRISEQCEGKGEGGEKKKVSLMVCVILPLQVGLKEAHWLRGAQEPGSHVLHEQPAADAFLYQPAAEGEVTGYRFSRMRPGCLVRRTCSSDYPAEAIASLLRVALFFGFLCALTVGATLSVA